MSVCCDPVESPIVPNNISYVYNVEIWHEKCYREEEQQQQEQE